MFSEDAASGLLAASSEGAWGSVVSSSGEASGSVAFSSAVASGGWVVGAEGAVAACSVLFAVAASASLFSLLGMSFSFMFAILRVVVLACHFVARGTKIFSRILGRYRCACGVCAARLAGGDRPSQTEPRVCLPANRENIPACVRGSSAAPLFFARLAN